MMKNVLKLLLTLCVTCISDVLFGQQTFEGDSVAQANQQDSVFISPDHRLVGINTIPAFIANGKDAIAFQTYAGLNVLNALRGRVPNLIINGDHFNPGAVGIRSGQALLIIDGLPHSGLISDHYNMNAMEYQDLYAVSGGNAVASYGYTASNGAIFLTSKNGAGHDRPVFEFNSTTFNKENVDNLPVPQPAEQRVYSHSFAYMQDYGDTDLRMSYNILSHPGNNGSNDLLNHNFKINTGFEFHPKVAGRLIFDHINGNRTIDAAANGQPTPQEVTFNDKRKHSQGNFTLSFELRPWFHINTQASLSSIVKDQTRSDEPKAKDRMRQRRAMANVFATIDLPLTDDLAFHSFAGIQRIDQLFVHGESYADNEREYDSRIVSGGGGIAYKNFLFGNITYRDERAGIFNTQPGIEYHVPSYGLSSVFIFTKAFNIPVLSSGKLRISKAKTNPWFDHGYPYYEPQIFDVYYDEAPQQKEMFEAGVDIGFLSDRLTLNATWFREENESTLGQQSLYGMTGYYRTYWIYPFGNRATGWELVANIKSLQQYKLKMNTTLTWSNYRRFDEIKDTYIQRPPNKTPDWQSSVLHQIRWKNLYASALVDFVYGGRRGYYVNDGSVKAHVTTLDMSGRFRDLSFGYIAARSRNAEKKYREVQISLSARNIYWYKQNDSSGSGDELFATPKNVSVSVSLVL